MGKWTTTTFIDAFMSNSLGRKRVHGTYRVLVGDHCRVLVRASVEYGRPAGSSLMAINLQPEVNTTTPLAFWHWHNYHNLTYRMRKGFDVSQWQALPQEMMSGKDEGLLASGIVEVNDQYALVEVGDKPFLMHRMQDDNGGWRKGFKWIDPVPTRVATIAEALALTSDPEGEVNVCGEWWALPQAVDFMPPVFDPEALKTMSTALNPLDYGYDMNEVYAQSIGYGSDEAYSLRPRTETLNAPYDAKAQGWMKAVIAWQQAAAAWESRSPTEYKGLSCQAKRYTTRVDPKTDGIILRTVQGVFVQGKLRSKENWGEATTLDRWHKLTTIAKRLRVGSC